MLHHLPAAQSTSFAQPMLVRIFAPLSVVSWTEWMSYRPHTSVPVAAAARFTETWKVSDAPAATEPADQKYRVALQSDLYGVTIEIYRLKAAGGMDYSKGPESAAVIAEYLAFETDPLKKVAAQKTLGDIMRLDGDFDKAVAAYRLVLAAKPDDSEAMAKLGLSLMAQGAAVVPEDKEKEQEGLNYMQKYTEMAPITAADSQADKELKQSVKDAVDYLKAQKMAPQKVATPPKKKP